MNMKHRIAGLHTWMEYHQTAAHFKTPQPNGSSIGRAKLHPTNALRAFQTCKSICDNENALPWRNQRPILALEYLYPVTVKKALQKLEPCVKGSLCELLAAETMGKLPFLVPRKDQRPQK